MSLKIFILEDELDRVPRSAMLEALKDHTLTTAESFDDAKEKYAGGYDILLLDHDMRGFYDDSEHPNTGYQFVKWLVKDLDRTKVKTTPQIVLHSQNGIGRRYMKLLLEEYRFHVVEMPFCRSYVEWLRTL